MHRRKLDRAKFLTFASELADDNEVELVWVDSKLHDAAMELLQRHRDKHYSLCDAVSFVLMSERRMHEALTTDRHFDQAGFRRLLPM